MMQWRKNLNDVRAAGRRLQQVRTQCVHDGLRLHVRMRQRPLAVLAVAAFVGYVGGRLSTRAQSGLLGMWRHPLPRMLWRWLSRI